MTERNRIPLAVSRLLVTAGFAICASIAVLLFILAGALAVAWPAVVTEALARGLQSKIVDIQPWASLLLATAGVMLALAARLFRRLRIVLDSISDGDPFTADNSRRLRHIGWLILVMQLLGAIAGWFGNRLPEATALGDGFSFSFSGLLAALLAFVVAQLFEQARCMRDELEGTV